MYRTPKCIENDTYSQNSLFLARMNFYKSGEAFFERLAEAAADDSQLHVARVTDDVVLVTGEHIGTRKLTIRLGRSREEVENRLADILRNQVALSYIRRFPICFEQSSRKTVGVERDTQTGAIIKSIALVDEERKWVFILETGMNYIYLRTVLTFGWGCGSQGTITLNCDTVVASVSREGFVSFGGSEHIHRNTLEEEVALIERRRKQKNQGR